MKIITKIKTFDGAEHESQKKAAQYLDVMYSDLVSRLASRLVGEKYQSVKNAIDENLDQFEKLLIIKRDTELQNEGNDDET
jgi:hypothetical protein